MISILMPLFNGKEFLDNSIPSILAQTYRKWELLIGVNGYSQEEYAAIHGEIKSKYDDERIRVEFIDGKGKTKALNKLKELAKNDIFALIDVDDFWLPYKLEKQLPLLEKYDVVGTDAGYFGDKFGGPGIFLGKLGISMFRIQNPVIFSSVILKRHNAHWSEDWEGLDDLHLWVHLMNKKKRFYNIPEVLTMHRIHQGSYYNGNPSNGEKAMTLISTLPKLNKETAEWLHKKLERRDWKEE